jgi:hypothetical protein
MERGVPSANAVARTRYFLRLVLRGTGLLLLLPGAAMVAALACAIALASTTTHTFGHASLTDLPGDLSLLLVPAAGAAFVGLILLFYQRRIVRWLAPMARPECPECGYPLRAAAARCPECGLNLGETAAGRS